MKKLFNAFCRAGVLCLLAFGGSAGAVVQTQPDVKALMVQKTDGTKLYYSLPSKPVITFADGLCKIESADVSASYPMSEVDFATFVDVPAGVGEVESGVVIDLSDPLSVRISGLKPAGAVRLFNLSGVMLRETVADGSGCAAVSLESLPQGVYVIFTNETTFKIYRK